jgi:hypothetical protein
MAILKVEYRDSATANNDWDLESENRVADFAEATYDLVMDLHKTASRSFALEVLRGWVLGGQVAESTAKDDDVTWRFTYVA